MSALTDKQEAAAKTRAEHLKDQNRLCQVAAELFATDAGKEILGHLVARFDVTGRCFLPCGDRGDVNALRAAVRDGERAAIMHLVRMIRSGNPDFPIPL
jgi:hypothetical protein